MGRSGARPAGYGSLGRAEVRGGRSPRVALYGGAYGVTGWLFHGWHRCGRVGANGHGLRCSERFAHESVLCPCPTS